MSFDVQFSVKAEGCGKYVTIHIPEHDSPTYNISEIFRKCMDWDFKQGGYDENDMYQKEYYPCDFVIKRIAHGLIELSGNFEKYRKYEPENGWGTVENVYTCLLTWNRELYELSERTEIPMNCIYFSW